MSMALDFPLSTALFITPFTVWPTVFIILLTMGNAMDLRAGSASASRGGIQRPL